MSISRYIINLPAAFLGSILLPIRTAYLSIKLALGILTIGFVASILFPILISLGLNSLNYSMISNVAISVFLVIPIVNALVLTGLAIAGVVLAISGVIDVVKSIWTGLRIGLTEGMDGIIRAYNEQSAPFTALFMHIGEIINRNPAPAGLLETDFDGFQQVNMEELRDVIVPPKVHDIPDFQNEAPQTQSKLLQPNEISSVTHLINEFSKLSVNFEIKEKLTTLKTRHEQYIHLAQRLDAVQTALKNNTKENIDDELIAYNSVETPILFIKQYQDNEQWHNVPAMSYITDKNSILEWLKTTATHPINRDEIKNPPKYLGHPTQYIWYELTANSCYSQELGAGTTEIRNLYQELSGLIPEVKIANQSNQSSSQSMFRPQVASNSEEFKSNNHQLKV